MNFAERLFAGTVCFIKRNAKVGDVVVSTANRVYEVTEVLRDFHGHIDLYGVRSLADGLPNAFKPWEVDTLAAVEAKDARAYYEQTRGL
jgi:hypothetical protein